MDKFTPPILCPSVLFPPFFVDNISGCILYGLVLLCFFFSLFSRLFLIAHICTFYIVIISSVHLASYKNVLLFLDIVCYTWCITPLCFHNVSRNKNEAFLYYKPFSLSIFFFSAFKFLNY